MPAHFCGIFGHKPTGLLVPSGGHIHVTPKSSTAETEKDELDDGRLVVGPLARHAADLALLTSILANKGSPIRSLARQPTPLTKARSFDIYIYIICPTSPNHYIIICCKIFIPQNVLKRLKIYFMVDGGSGALTSTVTMEIKERLRSLVSSLESEGAESCEV
jgi:Asp-tRNA(Asn)/Glu-tRNA(Gln) amidotransferase A subunit family amidase